MEVEYTLTPEDTEAFLRYFKESLRGKEPKWPHLRGIIWAVVLSLCIILLFLGGETGKVLVNGFVLLGIGVALGLLGAFIIDLVRGKVISKALIASFDDPHNFWRAGPWRVTISAEGMAVTSVLCVETVHWSIVWKTAVTPDHVFFFTASDDAYILPRRAFHDQQHFDDFLALARRYQEGKPQSTGIMTAPTPSTGITRDVP